MIIHCSKMAWIVTHTYSGYTMKEATQKNALKYAAPYIKKLEEYYKMKNESDLMVNDLFHQDSTAKEIKVYINNYNQQSEQKKAFAALSFLLAGIIIISVLYYVHSNKKKIKNIQELNSRIEELQRGVDQTNNSKNSALVMLMPDHYYISLKN